MAVQPDMPQDLAPPPRTALLQNLTQQSALLDQLFSALASTQSNAATNALGSLPGGDGQVISQTYNSLHSTIESFASIVNDVYDHQAAYAVMLEKQAEVERLERRVRETIIQLEQDRADLEGVVKEGEEVRKAIERSEKNPALAPSMIAHGLALAPFSSAPLAPRPAGGDSIQAGGRQAHPPFPTEGTMRMGLLFAMQGSMSGMGDTGKIGEEKAPGQQTAEQAQQQLQQAQQHTVVHEEPARRFDPEAVFDIGLGSDSEDE